MSADTTPLDLVSLGAAGRAPTPGEWIGFAAKTIRGQVDAHTKRDTPLRVEEMTAVAAALGEVLAAAEDIVRCLDQDGASWASLGPGGPLSFEWNGTVPEGVRRLGAGWDRAPLVTLLDHISTTLTDVSDDLQVARANVERMAVCMGALRHQPLPTEGEART